MAGRFRRGAEHGDALVGRLVAVAHRAQAQHAGVDRGLACLVATSDLRQAIDDARGQDHRARMPMAAMRIGGHEDIVLAAQGIDAACDDLHAERFGLFAQALQQCAPADAERKARAVVAGGNAPCAAGAGVDHRDPAAEPCEIGRGDQACGPGTDYQTVMNQAVMEVGHRANLAQPM